MRPALLPLALFACIALPGRLHAQEEKGALLANLNALLRTDREAERDSLNLPIKRDLRALLSKEDGLAFVMDDLPISHVDAPDGSFRLVTWNLPRNDGSHRYEGFLLAKQGSRNVLYELSDQTASITSPDLAELGTDRWYGALYYGVIPVKKGGKTLYTLLGWKGYSNAETRKVIDVLSFRGGKPRFGAAIFTPNDANARQGRLKTQRVIHGFFFQARMMLQYDPEGKRIVLDHLSPLRPDMAGTNALMGPDLSYDAYVWEKGQWRFQRDIDARDLRPSGKPFNPPPREP
ncbi:MAG: hypothetical protein IPL52_00690 [Flavobacteriales bacterium]|nr:hypothetical protein [Flavobacteriales bacterium]